MLSLPRSLIVYRFYWELPHTMISLHFEVITQFISCHLFCWWVIHCHFYCDKMRHIHFRKVVSFPGSFIRFFPIIFDFSVASLLCATSTWGQSLSVIVYFLYYLFSNFFQVYIKLILKLPNIFSISNNCSLKKNLCI